MEGEFIMDYFKAKQNGDRMAMLVISGHSCDDCANDKKRSYSDCPFEPPYDDETPVLNGVRICHKWEEK